MIVRALIKRNFISLRKDRGRYCSMIIYPVTFLVTYGLLTWSDVISKEQSVPFLLANLVWTMSSMVQSQTNLCMMVNLWSREFSELLREGVKPREMFMADSIFAIVIGLINLLVFAVCVPLFCGSAEPVIRLIEVFPSLIVCSLSVAAFIFGLVTWLGKNWAFLAWTGLQVIIMFSSPFVPLGRLPSVLQVIALCSPFTYLFEFVRHPQLYFLAVATLQGGIVLALGIFYMRRMTLAAKNGGGLHKI